MTISKKTSFILLISTALLILIIAWFVKPIPQPQAYHNFADQRTWLSIPNAWNVLSNIPYALIGLWGLFLLFSNKIILSHPQEKLPWLGIVIGLVLIALGSSYYHLDPDNGRLAWDRAAIMIFSMSFIGALITERMNIQVGLLIWVLLSIIGIYSAFHGLVDLRLYFGLQIFITLIVLIMLFIPSPYTRNRDLIIIILLYILAKLFEFFDQKIYFLTNYIISGHTLKHLASAAAGFCIIYMLYKRKIIRNTK